MKYLIVFFMTVLIFSGVFGSDETPVITYYGEIGCNHCDIFEDKILPDIERQTGVSVELRAFDILNSKYYKECEDLLNELGLEFTIFPVLFVGNNAYLGNSALEAGLVDELKYFKENGEFRPFSKSLSSSAGSISFGFVPVLLAGLIDGINPCAFATLVFFISFLSVQGRTRREILVTGILFTFSIFLSYLFLGLGLLNTMRMVVDMSFIRIIMKISVSVITGLFLVLSLRDFYLARSGRYNEITLQLTLSMKKKLHKIIRRNNGKTLFLGGVMITGFTVSLIELACTGQVYLPTIAYMIQTDNSTLGLRSLLIYNLGFIIPLIVVFGAVYYGLSSSSLTRFFTGKIHYAKLALSGLFLFLAVIIWFV